MTSLHTFTEECIFTLCSLKCLTLTMKETVANEMLEMLHELQLEKLELLRRQRPADLQFAEDLVEIQKEVPGDESDEAKEVRVAAEERVKAVVMEAGERVYHGDLLTFQKLTFAKLVGAPCVRALDRFEFLGVCRLQLFHLVMNMRAQDLLVAMPDLHNIDDRGSMAHCSAVMGTNKWLSNNKKKVVANFEPHHQHLRCYQGGLALNMWENFVKSTGINVSQLKSTEAVITVLNNMVEHYGARYWWDPAFSDPRPEMDNLFHCSRDQVIRLILNLTFSQAQHENDAKALRALRRTCVAFFLNHSSKSKYALHTLLDLVVELSASDRTRERMDNLVCVNVSGVKGGYMFR